MLYQFARRIFLCAVVLILSGSAFAQSAPRIAILGALPPLTDATDATDAAAVLKRDGFAPEIVTPEQIANPQFFTPSRFAALIVPHSRLFPAVAQPNLLAYLRGQGKLLCIGGPAFERYAYKENDVWKPRERLKKALSPALLAIKSPDLPALSPPDQVFHVGSEIAGAWLPIARERGIGFFGTRPGRLLPADGRGTETEYSPEVHKRQWAYLCLSGPMRGAVWGLNPKVNPPNEPTFTPLIAILKRILQGVYVVKAGAELPAYPLGQPAVIGAEFVNSGTPRKISAEIEIHGFSDPPFQKFITRPVETLAAGANSGYSETLQDLPAGSYLVRVTLFEENGAKEDERPVLDRLTAPFRVLPAAPRNSKATLEMAKGKSGFLRDGKPFQPSAAAFAPGWVSGQSDAEKKRGWLSPEQYDPESIAQDLAIEAKRGVTVVRIVYSNPNEAPGLRDFLAQCQELHLLADVALTETDAAKALSLIAAAHLTQNPAVFGIEISEKLTKNRADFIQNCHMFGLLVGAALVPVRENAMLALKPIQGDSGLDFVLIQRK